jgi:hypothetical protein
MIKKILLISLVSLSYCSAEAATPAINVTANLVSLHTDKSVRFYAKSSQNKFNLLETNSRSFQAQLAMPNSHSIKPEAIPVTLYADETQADGRHLCYSAETVVRLVGTRYELQAPDEIFKQPTTCNA